MNEKPSEELMALADVWTAALVLLASNEQRESLQRLFVAGAERAGREYGPRASAFLELAAEFIRQRSVDAHLLDTSPSTGR